MLYLVVVVIIKVKVFLRSLSLLFFFSFEKKGKQAKIALIFHSKCILQSCSTPFSIVTLSPASEESDLFGADIPIRLSSDEAESSS